MDSEASKPVVSTVILSTAGLAFFLLDYFNWAGHKRYIGIGVAICLLAFGLMRAFGAI